MQYAPTHLDFLDIQPIDVVKEIIDVKDGQRLTLLVFLFYRLVPWLFWPRVFCQAKPDEWFQCPPGFSDSNPLSQKNYYIPWNNDNGFNDQLLTILDLMWTQWPVDSLNVVGNSFYNWVKYLINKSWKFLNQTEKSLLSVEWVFLQTKCVKTMFHICELFMHTSVHSGRVTP